MVAVTAPNAAFTQSDEPLPHRARAKRILATHPDVRTLFKRDRWSVLWTVLLVALQVGIGIGAGLSSPVVGDRHRRLCGRRVREPCVVRADPRLYA